MIIDLSLVKAPNPQFYDFVIIGGGTAGIVLASRIHKNQPEAKICILESGSFEAESDVNQLDNFESYGKIDLSRSVARYLGGKSNLWDGRIISLEESELSLWNIELAELKFYINEALRMLGIRQDLDCLHEKASQIFSSDPIAGCFSGKILPSVAFFAPQIKRFNLTDISPISLRSSSYIDVFLHANVTSLDCKAGAINVVTHVIVEDSKRSHDEGLEIEGSRFIIANGGVEAIKLLMNSKKIWAGIARNAGKNFSGHPRGIKGLLRLKKPIPCDSPILSQVNFEGFPRMEIGLKLSPDLLGDFPTSRVVLNPVRASNHNKFYYWMRPQMSYMKNYLLDHGVAQGGFLAGFFAFAISYLSRKLKVRLNEKTSYLYLRNYCGSTLCPASQVKYMPPTESNAIGKVSVDWQISDIDKEGLRRAQSIILDKLDLCLGCEILDQVDAFSWSLWGGSSHFMSSTVMETGNGDGVVDKNQKIVGTKNIFVAGPSVFPTPSHANPMLMIVALSLRLGDFLSRL